MRNLKPQPKIISQSHTQLNGTPGVSAETLRADLIEEGKEGKIFSLWSGSEMRITKLIMLKHYVPMEGTIVGELAGNWVLLWSLKMLNSKLVISLPKSRFLAMKAIIFLIDLRIRNLKQNVKMSDQSNALGKVVQMLYEKTAWLPWFKRNERVCVYDDDQNPHCKKQKSLISFWNKRSTP